MQSLSAAEGRREGREGTDAASVAVTVAVASSSTEGSEGTRAADMGQSGTGMRGGVDPLLYKLQVVSLDRDWNLQLNPMDPADLRACLKDSKRSDAPEGTSSNEQEGAAEEDPTLDSMLSKSTITLDALKADFNSNMTVPSPLLSTTNQPNSQPPGASGPPWRS